MHDLGTVPGTAGGAGADRTARLRRILAVNAAFTAVSALVLMLGAGPIDELLGTDRPGIVALVGVALAIFALDVLAVRRGREGALVTGTFLIALADLGWVVASAVTIALGWYSAAGARTVAAATVVVAGLAVAELRAWTDHRARTVAPAGAGAHA